MNDVAWKALLPMIRKTVLQCGATAAGLAAVIFALIISNDQIVQAMSGVREFLSGPFLQAVVVVKDFILGLLGDLISDAWLFIGSLHYSFYLGFFLAYLWISCIWWKLKAVPELQNFSGKLRSAMALLGAGNYILLMAGMLHRSDDVKYYFLCLFVITAVKFIACDLIYSKQDFQYLHSEKNTDGNA